MSDPLRELCAYLDQGHVPIAWVMQHAPDGCLEAAWMACDDAEAMVQLYAQTGDRRGLALAACACARTTLPRVPAGDERPRLAIETAEAWARGAATPAQLQAAYYAAAVADASAAVAYASAAVAAIATAYDADRADRAHAAAAAAYDAGAHAAAAAAAYDAARTGARAGASAAAYADGSGTCVRLADVVRAAIPCPDLAAVLDRARDAEKVER